MVRIFLLAVCLALLVPAAAFAKDPVNETFLGVAIDGTDPVAYFDAQKWFATGEAIAHLNYLQSSGRISRTDAADTIQYAL